MGVLLGTSPGRPVRGVERRRRPDVRSSVHDPRGRAGHFSSTIKMIDHTTEETGGVPTTLLLPLKVFSWESTEVSLLLGGPGPCRVN